LLWLCQIFEDMSLIEVRIPNIRIKLERMWNIANAMNTYYLIEVSKISWQPTHFRLHLKCLPPTNYDKWFFRRTKIHLRRIWCLTKTNTHSICMYSIIKDISIDYRIVILFKYWSIGKDRSCMNPIEILKHIIQILSYIFLVWVDLKTFEFQILYNLIRYSIVSFDQFYLNLLIQSVLFTRVLRDWLIFCSILCPI